MIDTQSSLERRVDELAEQVRVLGIRLDELAGRTQAPAPRPAAAVETPPSSGEISLQWPSFTVLQGVAAACFVLVIALMLRTVADSGAIVRGLGVALGLVYAAALVAYGYRRHARGKPLGSVLAACGLLLLFAIVFEDHIRFGILPSGAAYLILSVACAAVVLLDRRHTPIVPVCLGIIGSAVTGLLIEFPEPHFAYLAALLVVANAAAYALRSRSGCRWLKWNVLGLTILFWFLWVLRIRTNEEQGIPFGPELATSLLVPWLLFYGAFYSAPVFWTIFIGRGRIGRFEALLPAVSLLGAYIVAARVPAQPVLGALSTPVVGVGCGVTFLLFAFVLAFRNHSHSRAAAAFAVPALVLLAVALPSATGSPALTLLFWSTAAFGVAVLSTPWRARAVRTSTYLLQAYGCGYAVATGVFAVQEALPLGAFVLALTLAVVSAAHYAWCRRTPSRHDASWTDSLDPYDFERLLPLFAAVAYSLAAARLILYVVCRQLPMGGADAFVCSQTVAISAAAVLLALLALRWMSHELLAAAALVAVASAGKLIAYDFLKAGGVPLVLGVFSFGLTAALGSLIWRRYAGWMNSSKPAGSGLPSP